MSCCGFKFVQGIDNLTTITVNSIAFLHCFDLFASTVEPVLGDPKPLLGRPQYPAWIISNNKVPGVSDHLPDATSDRVIWFNQR